MRATTWTCDRCGTRVEVPWTVHHYDDDPFGPVTFERTPPEADDLPGWHTVTDDTTVTHVCPGCVTAVERADALIREAEANVIFGESES